MMKNNQVVLQIPIVVCAKKYWRAHAAFRNHWRFDTPNDGFILVAAAIVCHQNEWNVITLLVCHQIAENLLKKKNLIEMKICIWEF